MKRVNMIVINRSKLRAVLTIIITGLICFTGIYAVTKKGSVAVFFNYRPAIENGIVGIRNEKRNKLSAVIAKISSAHENIIKHFFLIDDEEDFKQNFDEDIPEEPETETVEPEVWKVIRGMEMSNATDFDVDPNYYASEKLNFSLKNQGVEILIIHTHTTESYIGERYDRNAPDRDLDEEKNIVAVGETMAEVFKYYGIGVYHDKTVHDYPSYNGAYQRAAASIEKDMKDYPDIKIVLDVHRDAIVKEDGTKVKLLTDIGGVPAAQIMLVVGTNANLKHDRWQENFKFASKIQAKAIEEYPTLMRQINLRKERFNEHLTTGSLIIEVGTNGNTLDEAKEGGRLIAEVIKDVLKGNE